MSPHQVTAPDLVKTHHWVSQKGAPEASPTNKVWLEPTCGNVDETTMCPQGFQGPSQSGCKATAPVPPAITNTVQSVTFPSRPIHTSVDSCSSTRQKSPDPHCFLLIRKHNKSLQVQLKYCLLVKLGLVPSHASTHTHTHTNPLPLNGVQNFCFSFLNLLFKYN